MLNRLLALFRGGTDESDGGEPVPRRTPAGRLFASVTVVPGSSCCHAARKLRHKRTLVDEAPRLPLPDCTQPESCECTFEKHADRRANKNGDRRVPGLWQPGLWKAGGERRANRGRRASDR